MPKLPQLLTTAVGFVFFVMILGKFAWGPILNVLDERRGRVEDDYASAEKNLADAEQLKGDFENKLSDIKAIEREKVQEAVKRGEELADGIVTKARTSAEDTKHKAEQDIELEAHKAQIELRDSVVAMAIGAAEKVVGERLDNDLHRKLISEYIDGLDGSATNA
ncbi:MAG: F0F1 ATP synthase subunit B [Candidatus Krumholzibacteria bacterium]|nr:F0F1 ATP synthase subunit B [Candidatus Krumholzibacteria bacterium]